MILIAFAFFLFFNTLNYLRDKYHKEPEEKVDKARDGFSLDVGSGAIRDNPFPPKWKFIPRDNQNYARVDFPDSNWVEISPTLRMDSSESKVFHGIGWFRIHFKIKKELINEILTCKIEQNGASEFFLDGKPIFDYGVVSANPKEEVPEIARVPLFFSVPDTNTHVMAVRYSNHNYLSNYSKFEEDLAGISIAWTSDLSSGILSLLAGGKIAFWFTVLIVFFITLGIVHLLLYLFYMKMKENLYYSLFVFSFSAIIICLYLLLNTDDPHIYLMVRTYYLVLLVSFLLSIVLCLYSLFKPNYWKRMVVIQIILSLVCLFSSFNDTLHGISGIFVFANFLFTCIEAVRTVIFAIRNKMMGSNIIGTGVFIFFLFIFILIIDGIVIGTVSYKGSDEVLEYLMILALLCIVSIPISMSIYLAYVFSNTNRNLAVKLEEVEELSARSIAQEKEKQQILADQNFTLEKQVKERTAEIHEQKKVIEEKNKDIIDSINYAKRIQAAMLPEESVFNQIFANSFVIYEPRDIVSGDFYYATEINEKKLIIAADCTGHGVPGALMSMVGCNIINKLAHENGIVDPKLLIESLHIQLRQALKQDLPGSVNRDGMDVAAVLIDGKRITYAGANRPLIWFKNNNELMEIKPDKTPVGGSHINRIELTNHLLDTDKVKELFLFSDGFADQFGGPDQTIGGKKLMVSRFKQWLKEIIDLQSDDQAKFLKSGFDQWRGNNEQVDDVMVIGIKP